MFYKKIGENCHCVNGLCATFFKLKSRLFPHLNPASLSDYLANEVTSSPFKQNQV